MLLYRHVRSCTFSNTWPSSPATDPEVHFLMSPPFSSGPGSLVIRDSSHLQDHFPCPWLSACPRVSLTRVPSCKRYWHAVAPRPYEKGLRPPACLVRRWCFHPGSCAPTPAAPGDLALLFHRTVSSSLIPRYSHSSPTCCSSTKPRSHLGGHSAAPRYCQVFLVHLWQYSSL